MRIDASQPGFFVSGAAHLLLLLAALVAFSRTATFQDAQESVPVQVITNQQFNEIAKGEKSLKKVLPKPARRVDKVADTSKSRAHPTPQAKSDVPTPPPPLPRAIHPDHDKPAPALPQRVAALPPPRPAKAQPPAPMPPMRPQPKTPPPSPQAKSIEPPLPPQRPRMLTAQKETPAPLPPERPKLHRKEKLLDQKKLDQLIKSASAHSSRQQSSSRPLDTQHMNPAEIARLLSHDTPQERGSTGRKLTQLASLGSPTADAPRMSPSMWGALDGILQEQYKRCWSYLGLGTEHRYIPQIKVEYRADGGLATEPSLLNPPSDPSLRSLAESAMRAVRRCNPLQIPAQYAPYFDQWKARILRFDPAEMAMN